MPAYQIFTDATADLSPEMLSRMGSVKIIPMEVEIGGKTYSYAPDGDISPHEFYELQKAGNFASTSQINSDIYFKNFEPCLREGKDILYLCFTSGMSGTYQTVRLCADHLRERFPERKIVCIDTLCASVGEGLFVYEAARRQAEGLSLEELADWAAGHRMQVCHWFTVDTFEHLRHGGRVSGAAAAIGTVLNIKPLLHVDEQGQLAVAEKPRGRKRAISAQISRMKQGWTPEIAKTVIIGHGDCPEGAQQLKSAVAGQFPDAEIMIADIGPIIGAHTGPGMLAVVYFGSNR
ncbi:MAG: DegV family protein [Eubacteriales bacterium]|nr:DegV family protein [Eubacteriales bacterium]